VGFLLFYVSYFVLRPVRVYYTAKSLFSRKAANKSATYGRSMIREVVRIMRFKRSLHRNLLPSNLVESK
jgi:hypothetical protein